MAGRDGKPLSTALGGAASVADPLQQALLTHRAEDDEERHDLERLLLLGAKANPFDRGGALHVTASAVVLHPPTRRVLLRFHPRHGGWLQVGGHGDAGEIDPFAIALREAREETGLSDLVSFPDPSTANLVHVTIVPVRAAPQEAAHEHGDLRYLLATKRPGDVVAESRDAPLRWIGLGQAHTADLDSGLLRTLQRVTRLLEDDASKQR